MVRKVIKYKEIRAITYVQGELWLFGLIGIIGTYTGVVVNTGGVKHLR